jgi:hypothetical protein
MDGTLSSALSNERSVHFLSAHKVTCRLCSRVHPPPLINAVPVELLGNILSLTAKTWPCPSGPSCEVAHYRNLALLRITTVCSRWRSVAIASGALWNNIAFTTSELSTVQCAELFLGRSKGTMLSVYISDHGEDPEPTISQYVDSVIQKVAAASGRLKFCQIFLPPPPLWNDQTLHTPNIHQIIPGGQNQPDNGRFGILFLQLRSIASFSCTFWPPGNSRNLTSAELRSNDQPTKLTTLLDVLRGCEVLKSLVLQGFDSFHVTDSSPPAVVVMANLQRLNLFSCNSTRLLSHIELPSLSASLIVFDSTPYEDMLHSVPPNQRCAPYLQNLAKLQIVLNAGRAQYSIAAYRDDGCLALSVGVSGVVHWLRWGWIGASVEAVARFVPFSAIHNLSFSTDSIMTSWNLWLLNLRNLRKLSVACPGPDRVIRALLDSDPETGLPLCRTLTSLALHGCERRSINHACLKRLVLRRRATQTPLQQLTLREDEWMYMKGLDTSWSDLLESQSRFQCNGTLVPAADTLAS